MFGTLLHNLLFTATQGTIKKRSAQNITNKMHGRVSWLHVTLPPLCSVQCRVRGQRGDDRRQISQASHTKSTCATCLQAHHTFVFSGILHLSAVPQRTWHMRDRSNAWKTTKHHRINPSVKHHTLLGPEPWTNLLFKDRVGITLAWWTHTRIQRETHIHSHTGLMGPSCEGLRDTARQQLMWRGGRTCWPTKQREPGRMRGRWKDEGKVRQMRKRKT